MIFITIELSKTATAIEKLYFYMFFMEGFAWKYI